jgi:hypothetical protein
MTERHDAAGPDLPATLAEAIDRLAGELDDVHRHGSRGAVEYVRGATAFAAADGREVSFHLRAELAEAALRTPDAVPSRRGSGWVSLRPMVVDVFAVDRARAWFESAYRMAGESDQGTADRPRPH